jgi:predicted DNA-binding ribbon-helix-helix protein
MLISKNIYIPNGNTTVALEPIFWTVIDELSSKQSVSGWVRNQLMNKPESEGTASWMRQQVLGEVLKVAMLR